MRTAFRLSVLLPALLALSGMAGAGEAPLSFNTNPLAERGISPEVLDVVVSLPSQGPGFEMVVDLVEAGGEAAEGEQVILVSDPFTRYGLDVYLVHDGPPPQAKAREWKKTLERMMGTAFRVRGEQRLYDPATVEILSEDDRETVIGFRYDKMRVPWPMRHLLKMTGRVHVVDGRLDRIELIAEGPVKLWGKRVERFRETVRFARVAAGTGWLVDEVEIEIQGRGTSRPTRLHGRVLRYLDGAGAEIALDRTRTAPERPEFADPRTVQLKLSRALPVWGDAARQQGFELPKPYGIGLVTHFQKAEMSIESVAVRGIDVSGEVLSIVDPNGSEVSNSAGALSARADVWVLPFLNLELVAGEVRTESDVTLRLTQGFRNAVELLTGARLREFESFPASTSSTMLGAGLSTGFQHENLFGALSAQFATNRVAETGSELDILIATFLVGYDFGDIGLRVQTGAQYQDWDQVIIGTVPLGDGREPLDFEIDLSSSKTSFLAGLTKEIGSNWNATLLAGTGARDQVTLIVGYRF